MLHGSGLSLHAAGLAADDMVYHDPMMESVGPHVWLDYTQARPHHKHFCPKQLLLAQFQLIGVVLDKGGLSSLGASLSFGAREARTFLD